MDITVIMKTVLAALLITAAVTCNAKGSPANSDPWVSGFWQVTADEAKESLGEIVEFRPDQTVILWDSSCSSKNTPEELSYRLEGGDIYVTNHLIGDDQASFSLHPNPGKTELTLIWPGTGTKSTFTRMAGEGCPEEQRDPPLDPSPGFDLSAIAAQYHVPYCEVSVPLTQEKAMRIAVRDGDPHTEDRPEWAALAKEFRSGDQLRQVICVTTGASGMAAGDVFFGLFRAGKMIADVHTIIIN